MLLVALTASVTALHQDAVRLHTQLTDRVISSALLAWGQKGAKAHGLVSRVPLPGLDASASASCLALALHLQKEHSTLHLPQCFTLLARTSGLSVGEPLKDGPVRPQVTPDHEDLK